MPVEAVLFDIDGTLIDSNDLHVTAWRHAFSKHGFYFDRAVIHDQIGKGADTLLPTLLPQSDEGVRDALDQAQGDIFKRNFLELACPFPGARALLARVRESGQKVVWASSAGQSNLDHYLDLLGARELVNATTSKDDVGSTKPAPDIFEVALKKVAPIAAGDAVAVGDTPYDVEAALKLGIRTVGLLSGGFDKAVLLKAGAVAIYDDVDSLLTDYENSPLAP